MELKEQNNVAGESKLVLLRAVVVCRCVVGAVEAHLRTEQDRRSNPMPSADQVFGELRFGSGPLSHEIVEELIAEAEVIVLRDLILLVVEDGIVRREASYGLDVITDGSISACDKQLRRRGVLDVGRMAFVLVPGRGRDCASSSA
jgi:hypothetical protein